MKGELKAGGLALVIMAADSSAIGKCVTLIRIVVPGEIFTAPDGTVCRWLKHYPPAWLVSGNLYAGSKSDSGRYYGWAIFEPRSLMPIDGDDHQERDQLDKDKPAELTA